MNIKKTLTALLFLVLTLALTACGSSSQSSAKQKDLEGNDLARFFNEGFIAAMSTVDEVHYKALIMKDDSYDILYLAEAPMTAELYEEYCSIDYEDPDFETQLQQFMVSIPDMSVTDITHEIPTESELDAYIGQTLGDLEAAGFENSGYTIDEGEAHFFFDGPVYCVLVDLPEGTVIDDIDDLSANDIRALKIGKLHFQNFSYLFLE